MAFGLYPAVKEIHVEVEDERGDLTQFFYAV
jgi:hypothetical protein